MLDLLSRVPPNNVEAERAVLASMLLDRDVAGQVGGILPDGRCFYANSNALVYDTIRKLYDDGAPVDILTVGAAIGSQLAGIGGQGYLIDLVGGIPTTAHAEYYARIVREAFAKREQIAAGYAIVAAGYNENLTAEEAHAEGVSTLNGVSVLGGEEDEDMGAFLEDYMDRLEERGQSDHSLHLTSPWGQDLDYRWTLAKGDLGVVAARPSMGKTAWTMNYCWGVAQYARVDFWSLEMDRHRLMDRLVLMLEGVDHHRLKSGKLTDADWKAVARANKRVAESGLRLLKPKSLTAAGVRRATLKAQARGKGPSLVAIDYLQLMTHPKASRHDLEIGATTRALKLFAGEAGVALMLLSQLKRPGEDGGRGEKAVKRPGLTDLRGSGDIEQDADSVLFLHRPAYYDPQAAQEGLCENIIAKQRNGSIGMVPLNFVPSRQLFTVPEFIPPEDDFGPPPDNEDWRHAA